MLNAKWENTQIFVHFSNFLSVYGHLIIVTRFLPYPAVYSHCIPTCFTNIMPLSQTDWSDCLSSSTWKDLPSNSDLLAIKLSNPHLEGSFHLPIWLLLTKVLLGMLETTLHSDVKSLVFSTIGGMWFQHFFRPHVLVCCCLNLEAKNINVKDGNSLYIICMSIYIYILYIYIIIPSCRVKTVSKCQLWNCRFLRLHENLNHTSHRQT